MSTSKPKRFANWKAPEIHDGLLTTYNWLVQGVASLKLGQQTDIGAFTYINARYGITIEDHVQIGSHCSLYSVSTIDQKTGPICLRENCKIGSHSTVMPGVTVGKNTIVGAHSFVNRSLPDNVIAMGVPARISGTIPVSSEKGQRPRSSKGRPKRPPTVR